MSSLIFSLNATDLRIGGGVVDRGGLAVRIISSSDDELLCNSAGDDEEDEEDDESSLVTTFFPLVRFAVVSRPF